ncbi:MAG TPA: hypothetical protein VGW38_01245 [Chloroflexota bacterium]|nr:hypothetical protein [Chloroflexota bacterium]
MDIQLVGKIAVRRLLERSREPEIPRLALVDQRGLKGQEERDSTRHTLVPSRCHEACPIPRRVVSQQPIAL